MGAVDAALARTSSSIDSSFRCASVRGRAWRMLTRPPPGFYASVALLLELSLACSATDKNNQRRTEPHRYGSGSVVTSSVPSISDPRGVGNAIVAGVEGLKQEHSLPLRVVQTREPATVTGPAFVHFLAGLNRDYASKNAAVLRLLETKTRAQNPLVLLKFCYVDIDSPTDPGTMFEAYRDTVDTIQSEHPDVTVVHATIPLTTVESAVKSSAKQFLGRPTMIVKRSHRAAPL